MNPQGLALLAAAVAAASADRQLASTLPWPVFYVYGSTRETARELWTDCPGPPPVKFWLVALAVAEPGPFGEWVLLGICRVNRWRKRRHARQQAAVTAAA